MKTAAVIGANGFLGGAIVSSLLEIGVDVYAVHNGRTDNIDNGAEECHINYFLKSDIVPDVIFHAAGNYACTHAQLLEINDVLLQLSRKKAASKIVYISSSNVYGAHKENPIEENSSFNNPGLYAHSKIAGEFIVTAHNRYAILRLTYLYGRGITNSSFLPRIIKNAVENKEIVLFGQGERKQDYLHINDAVKFCIAAADLEDNAILLGATGISVSNSEVADTICSLTGAVVTYTGVETGDSFLFNPSATFKLLGWKPQVDFREGIKTMLL